MKANALFFGDNFDFLKNPAYFPDEFVDLIYLDPPFNSNRAYNVIFKEKSGAGSDAQIQAFEDVWYYDSAATVAAAEALRIGGPPVGSALTAFQTLLDGKGLRAYLSMMAARLVHLRRVLKPTGSIYLHCDTTASHYLKVLMDATFGAENFRNEIVWRRSHPKGLAFTRYARNHDTILFYAKDGEQVRWNPQYLRQSEEAMESQYNLKDPDGRRYQLTSLLNPNPDRPNLTYEFKGVTRVWRWTKERMLEADAKGQIVVPKGGEGVPRFKRYFDEQEGIPVSDLWNDIDIVTGNERMGYPTQKPLSLLERVLSASSNPGDVVLDPFCGCGTTIAAAQEMGRRWLGIDVTYIAIGQVEQRLRAAAMASGLPLPEYDVIGKPKTVEEARNLSKLSRDDGRYQFQYWALDLVGATYLKKKGADRGVDGKVYFQLASNGPMYSILVQAKSGSVNRGDVATLKGDMAREDVMGVLVTLEEPSRGPKGMEAEAADAGLYIPPDPIGASQPSFPKIQILSIADILERNKRIEHPGVRVGAAGLLPPPSVMVPLKQPKKARTKRLSEALVDAGED
jgi:site-specific DNA-methyltransferase (adenine-specific)